MNSAGHTCEEQRCAYRKPVETIMTPGTQGDQPPLVLIIDDDWNARSAVETLLELDGYRVAGASDGREALDLLEQGLRPSLILLDMNMPRMDGVAFRAIQLRRPALADIPVIVCSGCEQGQPDREALGEVVFLRKPMTINRLQDAIHQQCPIEIDSAVREH